MGTCRLENISKRFGNVTACDNVSLDVKDKEFKFLLGPSGAGKTTTLRIIAGLERPDSGRVYIDDEDITDCPPEERHVAMVFQKAALYPHMSVKENIEFPLKVAKYPSNIREKKVYETAELVKIADKLDQNVTTLSGGEMQRVALGRLLTQDASIYLMDEALTWLDAKLRILMRTEIKMLQDELGITVVFVTHDQEEALGMASSIVLVNDGIIQQEGEPYEIYKKPVNMWVADFIGTPAMNFLEGTVTEDLLFDCGTALLPLSAKCGEGIKAKNLVGKKVIAGFRPENMDIYQEEIKEGALKCEVRAVEFGGYRTIVDLSYADGLILKASINAQDKVPDKESFVWTRWTQNAEIIFDKNTQNRLV